jgi:hypothetical protein
LVAEIDAAFLCAYCGLLGRLAHAFYIDSWLNALRRDKRLIFVAAGAEQKASDNLLGETVRAPGPSEAMPVEAMATQSGVWTVPGIKTDGEALAGLLAAFFGVDLRLDLHHQRAQQKGPFLSYSGSSNSSGLGGTVVPPLK